MHMIYELVENPTGKMTPAAAYAWIMNAKKLDPTLSNRELGRQTGFSEATVRNYLSGKRIPEGANLNDTPPKVLPIATQIAVRESLDLMPTRYTTHKLTDSMKSGARTLLGMYSDLITDSIRDLQDIRATIAECDDPIVRVELTQKNVMLRISLFKTLHSMGMPTLDFIERHAMKDLQDDIEAKDSMIEEMRSGSEWVNTLLSHWTDPKDQAELQEIQERIWVELRALHSRESVPKSELVWVPTIEIGDWIESKLTPEYTARSNAAIDAYPEDESQIMELSEYPDYEARFLAYCRAKGLPDPE